MNRPTTRKVGYAYTDGSGNQVRLTTVAYPSAWELGYEYATGIDAMLGRTSALAESSGTHLAEYTYLGSRSVIKLDYPLATGNAGYRYDLDHGTPGAYAGLDRFGRVVDLVWCDRSTGATIDRVKYGYDRAGNQLWRENTALPQGVLSSGHTSLDTKNFQQQWTLDATGNWSEYS